MNTYYIYYHKEPISKEIKYIGKGKGQRAYDFHKRSKKHLKWIKSLKDKGLLPIVEIVEFFDAESAVLQKEAELIKLHRKNGSNLLNTSKYGAPSSGKLNGMYGKKRPDLVKRNKKLKGKCIEEIYGLDKAKEIKLKLSKANKGKNNAMYGIDGENAPCYGRTGKKHPMYGKNQTIEVKKKISNSLKLSRGKSIIRSDGKKYISLIDAAIDLGLKSQKEITKVLKGLRSNIKGYTFQYFT